MTAGVTVDSKERERLSGRARLSHSKDIPRRALERKQGDLLSFVQVESRNSVLCLESDYLGIGDTDDRENTAAL